MQTAFKPVVNLKAGQPKPSILNAHPGKSLPRVPRELCACDNKNPCQSHGTPEDVLPGEY